MIRLGVMGDLAAASAVFRRASLSNEGDRELLAAHPEYLLFDGQGLLEGRTLVAEADDSVVGLATWRDVNGAAELEDLFVDPDWMRRGLAAALVAHVVERLRARGVDRLRWLRIRTRWGSTARSGSPQLTSLRPPPGLPIGSSCAFIEVGREAAEPISLFRDLAHLSSTFSSRSRVRAPHWLMTGFVAA